MFVITIWLTVTKYPYLKWQWMLSVLPRFCITSITVKIFIGLDWVAQSVRYKKGRLFTLHEHMGSPPPQFLMGYVRIAHLFSLFLNCLSMFSVSLEFTSFPVFYGFRVAHIFSLFLTCSPMLSFSLEFPVLVANLVSILCFLSCVCLRPEFCVSNASSVYVLCSNESPSNVFVLSFVCPMLAVSMCCWVMSHPLTSSSWMLCVQCWHGLCVVQ